MSEEHGSFEVRERRRFTDTSGTDKPEVDESPPQAESAADGGNTAGTDAAAAPNGGEVHDSPVGKPGSDAAAGYDDTADATSGEENGGTGGAMSDIAVAGLLEFTLGTLAQLAWQNLGLLPNAATGKVEARLEEARLAIDAFAALLPVLSPQMQDSARRDMQNLLTNLRINFVEQQRRK